MVELLSDMFSILDVVVRQYFTLILIDFLNYRAKAEPDDYIEHQMSSKIESENADDWYWSAGEPDLSRL